ncbi:MAG: hypothetical protein AAF337_05535 [Pseudomonadota bacterium]
MIKDKNEALLRHEALHMASFLMRSVDTELLESQAIKQNEAWLALAQTAHQALFDLYQSMGAAAVTDPPQKER